MKYLLTLSLVLLGSCQTAHRDRAIALLEDMRTEVATVAEDLQTTKANIEAQDRALTETEQEVVDFVGAASNTVGQLATTLDSAGELIVALEAAAQQDSMGTAQAVAGGLQQSNVPLLQTIGGLGGLALALFGGKKYGDTLVQRSKAEVNQERDRKYLDQAKAVAIRSEQA